MLKKLAPGRTVGVIVALTLLLGLSACSALKLGYNAVPDLAYWWLDGYIDLADAQRTQVRGDLARLRDWHRREELPQFADLLGRLEQIVPGEITPQQACEVVTEVRTRLDATGNWLEPAAASLALTLNGRQLRHLERKFRSNNDTFRKEQVDATREQRLEKRYERVLERAEMIYGRLDEPQRAVLREGIAQSAYDAARILADRKRRQQDLLRTLRHIIGTPTPVADARMQLHAWRERAERAPDASYRAWQEGLVQEGCRIFSALHQSATAPQREQAVKRLRAYQRDLRELSGEPR